MPGSSAPTRARAPERKPDPYVESFLADATLPRVIVRAAECVLLADLPFPRPILDIGSGDGTFADALFDAPVDVGIDPWREQMLKSLPLKSYKHLAQAHGDRLPFRDATFATVFSNSTLEHTPDPAGILGDMCRVARPGAACYITVPSEHFPEYLLGTTLFNSVRLKKAADLYASFMNRVSRHVHIQPPAVWRGWLETAGFEVEEWRYYFSRRNTMMLDIAHYISIPSMVTHAVLGRWVLWPGKTRILPYRQLLSPISRPGEETQGAYLFFRCRKPE